MNSHPRPMPRLIDPPHLLAILFWICSIFSSALAQPAPLQFSDCFQGDVSQELNVSTIYGQVLHDEANGDSLNLTVLGNASQGIMGYSNNSLATLFTSTSMLTLSVWGNSSYFCDTLQPPTSNPNTDSAYCTPSGPFAFSQNVQWGNGRALTTLYTRLRAVDPFGNETLCVDIATTPLEPGQLNSPYGDAAYIFWGSIALAIAYWLVVGIARIVSAWSRGVSKPGAGVWSKVESAGFILASAISGERLATSPALMRFSTPSMRDIIFHTQWCAALAMVAVQWPTFVYPLLTQTGWSTLTYNISLTAASTGHHWDALSVPQYNPPSVFANQLNDPNSVLYVNASIPNSIFLLPANATDGMESFAYAIGLRPEDLFGVCLALFLAISAGAVGISALIWLAERLIATILSSLGHTLQIPPARAGTRSPIPFGSPNKEFLSPEPNGTLSGHLDEQRSLSPATPMLRGTSRLASTRKHWWKILRPEISSFHGSVLHGNLVRILVLFHFPVTVFSCYHMTLPAARPSIALAILSFIVFSLVLPIALVLRVTLTSTNKLYDETRTLLCFGPLYNHYRHGSQLFASLLFATNLAFGITIGCGQQSGTAQAIIILVVEVISALLTSVWLPWGQGAGMGLISFLFCVARIVIAVLLVILTPAISIGNGAGGWVAYAILAILALVYLAFLTMLVVKLVEAVVRIVAQIGFDHSSRVADTGLLGALLLLGCCRPRQKRSRRRYRAKEVIKRPPSDVSSYAPPTALGDGRGSRKTSTYSGPPPSVLRPEHALRPYREDSDDESGFIMGAWQPFPRTGYQAVTDPNNPINDQERERQQANSASNSGFSRVGGGRARYDAPYAIAGGGSAQTFPSAVSVSSRREASGSLPPVFADENDDDSPPPSVSHVQRDLPPGAMQPAFHTRTRSQTAIVEQLPVLAVPSASAQQQPQTAEFGFREDGQDGNTSSKKKYWFNLRRHRPQSEGGTPTSPRDEEAPAPQPEPGRSFVVIRDRRPPTGSQQQSSSSSAPQQSRSSSSTPRAPSTPQASSTPQTPSAWDGDAGSSRTRERPRSFVVVRDPRAQNMTQ